MIIKKCYRICKISGHLTPKPCKFYSMKPKKTPQKDRQRDLFRAFLSNIIDSIYGLVRLAKVVQWDRLDEIFGSTYCQDNGRPGVSTRFMVAMHYLKYTHNLSDEDVVATLVENPYWQYFSGMKWFENELPISVYSVHAPEVEFIIKKSLQAIWIWL